MRRRNSIQFFGLPGSGKTSILNALVEKFPEVYERMPKFTRGERFALTFRFMRRFPVVTAKFAVLILQNNPKLWSYIAHLVSHSFASHMYAMRTKIEKVCLIDEGVFQRLLTVAPKKFDERTAVKFVKLLGELHSNVVVMRGGDFGRFVFEPDRMTSYRNRFGPAYFKEWSENLFHNFTIVSKSLSGAFFTEKEGSVDELHERLQA